MKSIIRFVKHNIGITITLIITIIIGVICGRQVMLKDSEKIWELVFAICASILAAFIFYVIQVYVPEQKKKTTITPIIHRRLMTIFQTMNGGIDTLGKLYVPHHSEGMYSEEECKRILDLNLDDKVGVKKFNLYRNPEDVLSDELKFTVREWMLNMVTKVEEEIDKVFSYYGEYMTVNLDISLESVLQSDFHRIAKFFCRGSVPVRFSEGNNYIYDYQKLAYQLKEEIDKM